MLSVLFIATSIAAEDALELRFAYVFEQPSTQPYQLDGQTWYVHDSKGLALNDIVEIELLETTDRAQPIKVEISIAPSAHNALRQNIAQDGRFPGLVVLSEGEAVGSLPVLSRNIQPVFVLPILDAATNRRVYQAVIDQR